ncbi:MAG: 8-amino-7-oxononanoate synthase [Flavobacteriaceae bacterium]|nr:MAG: 8-amino-7-oxononanoate synthase [Flavobacteriaceae bacterium]
MDKNNNFRDCLSTLKKQNNLRCIATDSSEYALDLSSNDYLGLSSDVRLYDDFLKELQQNRFPFSASSSRLLLKNAQGHHNLEQLLASCYNAEACLIFNSGYQCNVGVISALASKNDLILADKFVHASCMDGALLSKATLKRYQHLNYEHLEQLLERYRKEYENVFIITESIFSMDGDRADLEKLVALKNQYKAFLYVDEAHAVGVRGRNGLGCLEEVGLIDQVDFIVGAFGKALASVGGFIVCSALIKSFLINHARSFMYSTALPPVNIAWTHFVVERLSDFKIRRLTLENTSREFSNLIGVKTQSNIIPYIVGSNSHAMELASNLKKEGFNVLPIRTPTVPENTARLRFSLAANHSIKNLLPIKNILIKYENKMVK